MRREHYEVTPRGRLIAANFAGALTIEFIDALVNGED